ncbi:MAG: hypothetical protein HC876_07455 [Chloroflexaceae bacterium]|nr:hypothetical protein [Chloroflexaceae bacterium]
MDTQLTHTTRVSTIPAARKLLIAALCCAAVMVLVGTAGWFFLAFMVLLFGPGYVLERLFPAAIEPAPFVRPTLWLGLSMALISVLYTWTTLVGVPLTAPLLIALTLVCGMLVLLCAWRDTAERSPLDDLSSDRIAPDILAWAALLVVLGVTVWMRFYQIRELALPAWVDSVHHALLIRVVAEQGQAPYSLQPYIPIENLPYHWGYHAVMAAAMQVSGLDLPRVMLWGGQIINALHVLTVAALATYFWRRPLAGVVAAIIVGTVSIMPAYYVSWGRYTQLMGLLAVPALAICWDSWLHRPTRRDWLLCVVLLAGLSIIHFRALVLGFGLLASSGGIWLAQVGDRAQIRQRILHGAGMAGAALLLAAPWLWVLVLQRLAPAVETPTNLVGGGDYNKLSEGLLWAGHTRWIVAGTLLAGAWGLLRRTRAAVILVGWTGIMLMLSNPPLITYVLPAVGVTLLLHAMQNRKLGIGLLGVLLVLCNPRLVWVPFFWLITNEVVVISLFMPLAALVGGGVALLYSRLLPSFPRGSEWMQIGTIGALAALLVWSAWDGRNVLNPDTILPQPAM